MKKLDFSEALNFLSDETVKEADSAREKSAPKKPYLKYAAIAACAAVVIASAVIVGVNSRLSIGPAPEPDKGGEVTELPESDKGGETDSQDSGSGKTTGIDNLSAITVPVNYGGSGDGGIFLKDISELLTEEWDAEKIGSLPVYKNATKWYGSYPESTDREKMAETLNRFAELFGLDLGSLEIKEASIPSQSSEDDLDGLFESRWGIEAPPGVDQPEQLTAYQNGITVTVTGEYSVSVDFENPLPLPEGLSDSTPEQAEKLAEYLISEYSDRLAMDNPTATVTGGERDVCGQRGGYTVLVYDQTGDPAQDFINRSFRGVSFVTDGGELCGINYDITNIENIRQECELISEEQAVELFTEGEYLGAADSDVNDAEYVKRAELCYFSGKTDEYYFPCYRLYVYFPDAPIESQSSLSLYDIYYVPAIDHSLFGDALTAEELLAVNCGGTSAIGLGSTGDIWAEDYKPESGRLWWGETLPIYENSVRYRSCGGNGSYRYLDCDSDYMLDRLESMMSAFGLDIGAYEISESSNASSTERVRQNLEREGISSKDEIDSIIEKYVLPDGYSVETEDYVFEISAGELSGYTASVRFKNGEELGGDALNRAEMIAEKYGWFLPGEGEIIAEETDGELNIWRGSDSDEITSAGNSSAEIETYLNRTFHRVSARFDGERLTGLYAVLDGSYSKLGDYRLLGSYDRLAERLGEMSFPYSSVKKPDPENIVGVSLNYRLGCPCFTVTVDITDQLPAEDRAGHVGERCYYEYEVPAADADFRAPFEIEDARFCGSADRIYDGVLVDAKPCSEKSWEALGDIFGRADSNSLIGSFYELIINEVISPEDAVWLNGYNLASSDGLATFYKATVIYDYFAGKAMNKNTVIRLDGSVERQIAGCPPYSEGDRIAVLLYRESLKSDFQRMFCDNTLIYDVAAVNGVEYLVARGQSVPGLEADLTNYLTDKTAELITTTTYNPAVYHGAYAPEELAEALKRAVDGAEKLPLENVVENKYGPGAVAVGMTETDPPIDGGDYVAESLAETLYSGITLGEPSPATGSAQGYDEYAQYLDSGDRVIAYEITNIYSYDEAVSLYGEFNKNRTLYRAHGFYDLTNDCPIDVWFDVTGWGSTEWQEEGWPVYSEGDRLVSTLNNFDDPPMGYQLPDSETEFLLLNVGGKRLAYHIGKENIRFEGDYPNIDLEMAESERSYKSSTEGNPFILTQKSSFESLVDFFHNDYFKRGLIKSDSESLPKITPELGSVSAGFEGCSVSDISNLDGGSPWVELKITDQTTLPVYRQKLYRDYQDNGRIVGANTDFMVEAAKFYARGFGLDPAKVTLKDSGDSVSAVCEQDGVEIEVTVTDGMNYIAYIRLEDGFGLSEGAKVGFYNGAAREEAERAEAELLMRYEWLIGYNDAGRTEVIASEEDNCYVRMYHPLSGYEMIPYEDGTVPEDSPDDIIQSIINYSLNCIDFMDDGVIHIHGVIDGFFEQYEKLGDYPIITPEEALARIDSGRYLTTAAGSEKTSADVVYTELIYRSDGIPYYRCYVSLGGWQGVGAETYGAYYVPAVRDEYIDGSTPWDGRFN